MNRIAGEFCSWLRELPGEDRTVNNIGEAHLRGLFDTAQSSNPGRTKLAEGLRAWAKFGATVTGGGGPGIAETVLPLINQKRFAEKILGRKTGSLSSRKAETGGGARKLKRRKESKRSRRLQYGIWYLHPQKWQERHVRLIATRGGLNIQDKSKIGLRACLPGPVDMLGGTQPVHQLQATVAFGEFLGLRGIRKPRFVQHILQ
ncbi:uncharacterized protein LOC111697851 isoform X2 [Eurytemora carolleeae]|uniref:uncharacterized protein LOC111697851 isoform X2 n=1 Tax=Eurytemora carolleeae TaxID=1294199 RepID=UPI000C76B57D|nr:uncharacterized protein LOC111697851 isoform X2 [Eurytemora carolleeae]|eukprot:XP_023323755.1 uncharacterized protein LOC111697851 isoform X2 [Eurytemora affinis]